LLGISQTFVVSMKRRKPQSRKFGISVEALAELAQHLLSRRRSRSQDLPQDRGGWQPFMHWPVPYSLMVVTYRERKESSRENEKR